MARHSSGTGSNQRRELPAFEAIPIETVGPHGKEKEGAFLVALIHGERPTLPRAAHASPLHPPKHTAGGE